jgi:predicted NUDIX family phosphoesterase
MKKILVTPSQWVNSANKHNTVITGRAAENILDYIIKHQVYKERSLMEETPAYRQIIPYVMVDNENNEFVLLQRMPAAGEERLRGFHYFGVGGHIEYSDKNAANPIEAAALREIQEELGFNKGELVFHGVILTSETPVDRVHLGMLYSYTTNERQFQTNEMAINNPTWVTSDVLAKHYGNFEPWSKLAYDYIFSE